MNDPTTATINYNNILQSSQNSVYLAAVTNDIDATNNWWGTTDSAVISQSIYDYNSDFNLGRVNFAPILTALNPSAPSPDTQIPQVNIANPTETSQPTPQPSVPEIPPQTAIILPLLLAASLLLLAVTKNVKAKISNSSSSPT